MAAFLDHWKQLHERLVVGEDLAAARADRFLAGSPQARLHTSRRFYSEEHAGRLATLAESEVRELLEPWLETAIDYWLQEEVDRQDVFSRLRTCPTSEYLMVVERYAGGLLVDRYPGDDSCYDDVYERMAAGCSVGGIVRVFIKSTGEAFTPGERRSAEGGLKREFAIGYADAGDDARWVCSVWDTADDREVVVCIGEDHVNRAAPR